MADVSWYDPAQSTYTISSVEQLAGLALLCAGIDFDGRDAQTMPSGGLSFAGKTINLAADIDIGGIPWVPIGRTSDSEGGKYFQGNFNGNGHTIRGISSFTYSYNKALFGRLRGGVIENLVVEGSITTEGHFDAGGVAAQAENEVFRNIQSNVDIHCPGSGYAQPSVGGIVAYASNCTYEQLEYNGSITGIAEMAGGIAGFAYGGTSSFFQCANKGTISTSRYGGDDGDDHAAGGIVGATSAYGSYSIDQCYNTGTIATELSSAGGIVGYLGGDNSSISNCYNLGDVSGRLHSGGINGRMDAINGTVSNTYSAGNVTGGAAAGIVSSSLRATSNFATNNYFLEGTAPGAFSDGTNGTVLTGSGELRTLEQLKHQDMVDALNASPSMFSASPEMHDGLPGLTWEGYAQPGRSSNPGQGTSDEGDGTGGGSDGGGGDTDLDGTGGTGTEGNHENEHEGRDGTGTGESDGNGSGESEGSGTGDGSGDGTGSGSGTGENDDSTGGDVGVSTDGGSDASGGSPESEADSPSGEPADTAQGAASGEESPNEQATETEPENASKATQAEADSFEEGAEAQGDAATPSRFSVLELSEKMKAPEDPVEIEEAPLWFKVVCLIGALAMLAWGVVWEYADFRTQRGRKRRQVVPSAQ